MQKRIWSILLALVFGSFAAVTRVSAASYSVSLTGDSTFSDSIILNLTVKNSQSMGGSCGGVCGITGVLEYDSSKIELMSASGMQGFDFAQGTQIVLYKSTAASDGGVLSLKFRNVGLSSGQSTTVSVSNLTVTNGDTENSLNTTTKTIQYKKQQAEPSPQPQPPVEPQKDNNSSTTNSNNNQNNSSNNQSTPGSEVNLNYNSDYPVPNQNQDDNSSSETNSDEAESETSKDNATNNVAKSSNASLKELKISVGDLKFKKDILSYDVAVGGETTSIDISAAAEGNNATITGAGEHQLAYGLNRFEINVKAEDGSIKEYVINVYRDGANEVISSNENTIRILMIVLIVLGLIIIGCIIWWIIWLIRRKKSHINENNGFNL